MPICYPSQGGAGIAGEVKTKKKKKTTKRKK